MTATAVITSIDHKMQTLCWLSLMHFGNALSDSIQFTSTGAIWMGLFQFLNAFSEWCLGNRSVSSLSFLNNVLLKSCRPLYHWNSQWQHYSSWESWDYFLVFFTSRKRQYNMPILSIWLNGFWKLHKPVEPSSKQERESISTNLESSPGPVSS